MAFFSASARMMRSRISRRLTVLRPMTPPPHVRVAVVDSLNCERAMSWSASSLARSSLFTSVRHTAVAFFWCTTWPRVPLFLMMTYGTPCFLHSAGSHTISSMGSTSAAITTSCAFCCSMSVVTWFRPNLTTLGALEATSLPAAVASAASLRRLRFCALVSGWYFSSSLNRFLLWFLSSAFLNWLMEGGTFRRWKSTLRWRCTRT
mmetsp:Transcript_47880/g.133335  ORF Transcript_47880/g.133335 Transcript_47880/m.133335 type:complete len:205 (-) Transcript_47880:186-800(-)